MSDDRINLSQYLQKIETIYTSILAFLENEDNEEENFQNIIKYQNTLDNKQDLKTILYILLNISNNHYRNANCFSKIEKILQLFKEHIIKYFSSSEIFKIFMDNKRIVLFLVNEKIININKSIVLQMTEKKLAQKNYPKYFLPEIQPFIDELNTDNNEEEDYGPFTVIRFNSEYKFNFKELKRTKIPEDFEEKRKKGENDMEICELIRNDLIDEFISFVNKKDYNLNMHIESSIYETNEFLLNNTPSLIQYAAFFGSIQIFKYLYKNKVELIPFIWNYAVHGNDEEIIHILEDNNVEIKFNSLLNTAIGCHHNNIVNYFINKKIEENCTEEFDIIKSALKYYNFIFIDGNKIDENQLFVLCKYDHSSLINVLLQERNIDVNITEHSTKTGNFLTDDKAETTPLICAIENGNIDVVNVLLQNDKLDINLPYKEKGKGLIWSYPSLKEKYALFIAVENKNLEMIKLLLSNNKIDVNRCSKIMDSDVRCQSLGTVNKITVEQNGFHLAVSNEDIDIIKIFLSNDKTDVNYPILESQHIENKFGNNPTMILIPQDLESTVLHIAIRANNIEIVKLLLENDKLDVNSFTKELHIRQVDQNLQEEIKYDQTALQLAIEKNLLEIVELLLNNDKIDVNTKRHEEHRIQRMDNKKTLMEGCAKETALCMAIKRDNYDIVRLLLKKDDLDINDPYILEMPEEKSFGNMSNERKTPLHLAVEKDDIEMVNILLQNKKIDVNAVDEKGRKSIELTNDDSIKKLLQ